MTTSAQDQRRLTPNEQAIWLKEQLSPGITAHNIFSALEALDELDAPTLRQAIEDVTASEPALRTVVGLSGAGDEPQKTVLDEMPVDFEFVDATTWAAPEIEAYLAAEQARTFDIANGPLARYRLITTKATRYFTLCVHHLVCDMWSMILLVDAVTKRYHDLQQGTAEPLGSAAVPPIKERTDEDLEADRGFWATELADPPEPLELPLDRIRPVRSNWRGDTRALTISSDRTAQLKSFAQNHDTTLHTVILAAYTMWLHRLTEQDDLVLGTPRAGRGLRTARSLGYFVNPVVLRSKFAAATTFADHLQATDATVKRVARHDDYPVQAQAARLQSAGSSPVDAMRAVFAWQRSTRVVDRDFSSASAIGRPGVIAEINGYRFRTTPFFERVSGHELMLLAAEVGAELEVVFDYQTALFDAASIELMLAQLDHLLQQAITNPSAPVADLDLLPPAQRDHVLAISRGPSLEVSGPLSIAAQVREQCAETPDRVAAIDADGQLTYEQLGEMSGSIAEALVDGNVTAGDVVAICTTRCKEFLAAALAVGQLGAAYLVVDPALPERRRAFMLEDAGARALITNIETVSAQVGVPVVSIADHVGQREKAWRHGVPADADALAYLSYTSGSTGQPKAVETTNRSIVNLLASAAMELGFGAEEETVAVIPFNFEPSMVDLWLPLVHGGSVYIADEDARRDGHALTKILTQTGATQMVATPPTWRGLVEAGWSGSQDFRCVSGGETMPGDLVADLLPRTGALWYSYGPTETTLWSTNGLITQPSAPVPVGKPIHNTTIYVLDKHRALLPMGAPGEIYIGGAGVARGYRNQVDLTKHAFVEDPFSPEPTARMYRTGDRGRWTSNGQLEFLGRVDEQLKVRGHRIEPAEVEAAFLSHPAVANAAAVGRILVGNELSLVVYAVTNAEVQPDALRDHAAELLPSALVPSVVVIVDEIPITSNGKVDRAALPDPRTTVVDDRTRVEPETETERFLAGVWSEVLGVDEPGATDDFFDLGGQSLLATQIVSRIRNQRRVDVAVRAVFDHPTIRDLAIVVNEAPPLARAIADFAPAPGEGDASALSSAQRRLWFLQQLDPDSTAHNSAGAVRLRGPLDSGALHQALDAVVARHDMLRTSFPEIDGTPISVVDPDWGIDHVVIDHRDQPEGTALAAAEAAIAEDMAKPFALDSLPLVRITLHIVGPDDHLLAVNMHHIVGDQWSFALILRELSEAYAAFRSGQEPTWSGDLTQFANFAAMHQAWLDDGVGEHQAAYWRNRLADVQPLDLPTDRPRPDTRSEAGESVHVEIPADVVAGIADLASNAAVSQFSAWLATLQLLLARWAGQSDVAVGTPIANRHHLESETVVGALINMVVLRSDLRLGSGYRFDELLHSVHQRSLEAQDHQDLPFEEVVECVDVPRDLSRAPLFDVLFNLEDNALESLQLPEIEATHHPLNRGTAAHDIALSIDPATASVTVEYSTALFDRERIDRLVADWWNAIRSTAATPSIVVDDVALDNAAEFVKAPQQATVLAASQPAYAAPESHNQQVLSEIFGDVLGTDLVGIDDSFFERGGHSLLATQIVSRIRRDLGVDLPVRSIFEAPTIRELAPVVAKATQMASRPPIQAVDTSQPVPLSYAQERMWFLHQFDPEGSAYNMAGAALLEGDLDVAAIERALTRVVGRHATLRTTFELIDGRPMQRVHDPAPPARVNVVDWTRHPADRRLDAAVAACTESARRPFDLGSLPVITMTLHQLGAIDAAGTGSTRDQTVLFLNKHHIVGDQWSFGVLFDELAALYREEQGGEPAALDEVEVQYVDYAMWQRDWLDAGALDAQLNYWRDQLDGLTDLDLPTDFARPAVLGTKGAVSVTDVPTSTADRVEQVARAHQVSPYMVYLSAFIALVHRYSGAGDIAVGTPVANRNAVESERLISSLVNTVVLRVKTGPDDSFTDLLAKVQEVAFGAYEHQDVPFEKLVSDLRPNRDTSRSPLFQLFFNMQNAPFEAPEFDDISLVDTIPLDRGAAQFDLSLNIDPMLSNAAGIEYNTDLFAANTIDRFLEHYWRLLDDALAKPATSIADLQVLGSSETHQLLHDWNATDAPLDLGATLHRLIETSVGENASSIAVTDQTKALSYLELNAQANQLAHHLKELGAAPGTVVGLGVDRSVDLVVAALAIMKTGAAYLPLDPSHPADRLAFILEDAEVSLLVTKADLAESWPAFSGATVLLDEHAGAIAALPAEPVDVVVSGADLVYVIYTSGSTGRPKGVRVTHANVVNFLTSMAETPGITAEDTLLAVTTPSFDISVLELFLPLTAGARVVVASTDTIADGRALANLIRDESVTMMQATPAGWRVLVGSGWEGSPELRALCGGEELPRDLAEQLLTRCSELWNMYGPTETTVWSMASRVVSGEGPVPLSGPIANTAIYVLDERGAPAPIGVPGDLYIGGAGVTAGYHNRPELTSERFVNDPFRPEAHARMYNVGDRARYRADGSVEFLGRSDFQVKVRGYRIELGEIEAELAAHPAVDQAVVVVREFSAGDSRLVAYTVAGSGDGAASEAELREHLGATLPSYMIPSAFVSLDALPLTPNLKVDRKALPAPARAADSQATWEAPSGQLERNLAKIWEDALGVSGIGRHDNFFDLGGHSLLAVRVFAQIEELTGEAYPLTSLFRGPTIAELAAVLRDGGYQSEFTSLVAVQPNGSRQPFFSVSPFLITTLSYQLLARYLGPDQPLYAFQPQGLEGEHPPHHTVQEMAAHYIDEMRAVQPHGPYLIGGHCAGNWVAFEMATQLQTMGEEVALLALVDSEPPNITPPPQPQLQRAFSRLMLYARSGRLRQALGWQVGLARQRLALRWSNSPAQQRVAEVRAIHAQAHGNFRAGRFHGDALLIRSRESTELRDCDWHLRWAELIDGELRTATVPGTHATLMLEDDNTETMARHITSAIDAVQGSVD